MILRPLSRKSLSSKNRMRQSTEMCNLCFAFTLLSAVTCLVWVIIELLLYERNKKQTTCEWCKRPYSTEHVDIWHSEVANDILVMKLMQSQECTIFMSKANALEQTEWLLVNILAKELKYSNFPCGLYFSPSFSLSLSPVIRSFCFVLFILYFYHLAPSLDCFHNKTLLLLRCVCVYLLCLSLFEVDKRRVRVLLKTFRTMWCGVYRLSLIKLRFWHSFQLR